MSEEKLADLEPEEELVRVFSEPMHEIVVITPEQAQDWLTENKRNRKERTKGTVAYSRDMSNDEWLFTGDTIKFDWFGRLIDGQHRLKACVASGKPIVSLVVWGVDPRAQGRVDTGMGRAYRDQLQMADVRYPNTVAAACRRVFLWNPPNNERISFGRSKVTHAELEKTFAAHPELMHCAAFVESINSTVELSKSLQAFLFWVLLMNADPENAQVFIRKLATGAGLEERDPILVFREWIYRQKGGKSRRFEGEVLWKTAIAWNHWMSGRRIGKLQLPQGGMKPDTFPRLKTVRRDFPDETAEVNDDE